MPGYKMIVLTRPVDGREEEFNDWYNNVHLPEVLGTDGFVAAQRFKLAGGPDAPAPYLAIYEVESDDYEASLAMLLQRVDEGKIGISSALDVPSAIAAGFEPITGRVTA